MLSTEFSFSSNRLAVSALSSYALYMFGAVIWCCVFVVVFYIFIFFRFDFFLRFPFCLFAMLAVRRSGVKTITKSSCELKLNIIVQNSVCIFHSVLSPSLSLEYFYTYDRALRFRDTTRSLYGMCALFVYECAFVWVCALATRAIYCCFFIPFHFFHSILCLSV